MLIVLNEYQSAPQADARNTIYNNDLEQASPQNTQARFLLVYDYGVHAGYRPIFLRKHSF